jgi:two-component system, chemotaxis family, chemotaxis protein CheY
MILIDEDAERELATLLDAVKLGAEPASRCIDIQCTDKAAAAGLKAVVIASAQQHLHPYNPRIFFCESGDVVIVADDLPTRDGNLLILDVVDYLKKPAEQSWVTFDELSRQVHDLQARIEPVLAHKRQIEEAARKLHEKQQHERKRQAILGNGAAIASREIEQRRSKRQAPQLMIIEDDAFTCRLVENVLQKKYALTSLSEADYAMDTYARLAPDLLFLDINLPDVTGHELLERLLAIDPAAHVIMLSGNADHANIAQAMHKGAKGFIAKPFTREKLFQYIDRCSGITRKQRSMSLS